MPATPEITNWLSQQRGAMEALLSNLVNIDSGSYLPAGIAEVRDHIARFLTEAGVSCAPLPTAGPVDALIAWVGAADATAPILLLGHMDTVFAAGEAARRPFSILGSVGYGPGCADMKAGLVMNAFLLAAFARHRARAPLRALFTCDEEIGSPAGRPIIEAAAKSARAVLNAEPGRTSGNIVSARRGGTFFHVTVRGKAAHAGLNPGVGRSAIGALAAKITAWHALTSEADDVSVNVGLIAGGVAVNTVAPWAEAWIDLRFPDAAIGARLESDVRAIAESSSDPDIAARIEVTGGFLPLIPDAAATKLCEIYLAEARAIGLSIDHEFTRSCADSGFAAAVGAPTICATGPVGWHPHTPEECVELETLVPRAVAAARTIQAITKAN